MTDAKTAEQEEAERRIAPRLRTLKRARVLFNNRYSTIDCIVRNVSRTGALLTIDTAVHLPMVFEVSVGEEGIRPAKLVYRREMFAGIRFLDVEPEEDLPPGETLIADAGQPIAGEEAAARPISRIVAPPLPSDVTDIFPWAAYR